MLRTFRCRCYNMGHVLTMEFTLNYTRVLLLTVILFSLPAGAWWSCDWDSRFAINISKPAGPPLTNAQVLVALTAANVPAGFDWSNNGDDIRFVDTNDVTELDFFIELWDASAQTARIWVLVPSIPGSGRTVYLYYGAPPGTPNASTPFTFTEPGLKFHTRRSTVDPVNRATAEAAFSAASNNVAGYGCAIISNYTGVTNVGLFAPPSRNGEFGLSAEVFFQVSPAEAGVWQFRYGADFGRGGGLYVDEIALDEKWNTDLWWGLNWNNTAETLSGSINLAPGTHSFRILGFEGCCDGGLTAQFQRPGGTWQAMALANIDLRSRSCLSVEPSVAFGPGVAATCPILDVTRSTQAFSDSFSPPADSKRIPGSLILNVTGITNTGVGAVDADSVVVTEAIPPNMALRVADFDGLTSGPVQFANGTPSSGLSFFFGGLNDPSDDLWFSADGGTSYGYQPTADGNGVDLAITHFQITPGNAFLGNSGSGAPSAEFRFKTMVR